MRKFWLISWLAFGGCAGEGPLVDAVLDSGTGITHWQPDAPIVFSHAQPELAATGGDHLLVAPIAVSRQGTRRQYLWLSFASSIDRELSGADWPLVDAYILMVDETPMLLDVRPWEEISRVRPYDAAMSSANMLGARISASQLEQLSTANTLSVVLTGGDQRVMRFVSRDVREGQVLFSAAIAADF